jgi:hypothetical protein
MLEKLEAALVKVQGYLKTNKYEACVKFAFNVEGPFCGDDVRLNECFKRIGYNFTYMAYENRDKNFYSAAKFIEAELGTAIHAAKLEA